MLEPTIPGWKVETVGDDIAWMRFGADGRLYAINPEAGFFGVAPGTSMDDQPQRHALAATRNMHLHQRRADRRRRRVVGGHDRRAAGAPHRLEGQRLDARSPTSPPRTRTRASPRRPTQCPSIAAEWEDPAGVPISAILFGGRRATNVPLVTEALSTGSTACSSARPSASEKTAAAEGDRRRAAPRPVRDAAVLRLQHGRLLGALARRSARRTDAGQAAAASSRSTGSARTPTATFIWPGFGENSRVLEWIVDRLEGEADADRDPDRAHAQAGRPARRGPRHRSDAALAELFEVDRDSWLAEADLTARVLRPSSATRCRPSSYAQLEAIKARLSA